MSIVNSRHAPVDDLSSSGCSFTTSPEEPGEIASRVGEKLHLTVAKQVEGYRIGFGRAWTPVWSGARNTCLKGNWDMAIKKAAHMNGLNQKIKAMLGIQGIKVYGHAKNAYKDKICGHLILLVQQISKKEENNSNDKGQNAQFQVNCLKTANNNGCYTGV